MVSTFDPCPGDEDRAKILRFNLKNWKLSISDLADADLATLRQVARLLREARAMLAREEDDE